MDMSRLRREVCASGVVINCDGFSPQHSPKGLLRRKMNSLNPDMMGDALEVQSERRAM